MEEWGMGEMLLHRGEQQKRTDGRFAKTLDTEALAEPSMSRADSLRR
jgi:hypothetical protein